MTPDDLDPRVRADIEFIAQRAIDGYRDMMRARVEALPTMGTLHSPLNAEPSTMVVVLRSDVLALIGGSDD